MVRTPHIDEKGVKKGTWTVEEDKKLIAYVSRYGCWNWRQLPKYAGLSRCGKSCRLRWMNYLRPNIRRGNYSKEEEDIIIKLHDSLGNRWSMIASHLPGRTDNEIKNHWHGYLKKRLIQSSSSFKPQSGSSEHSANPEDKEDTPMNSPYVDQPIVQSSRFSPKPLSAECSSSNADTGVVTDTDCFAGNDISPADIILENGGNFWAEPFVPDNYIYSTPTYCLEPFMDDGILYPPSPFRGNEFYSSDLMYNY